MRGKTGIFSAVIFVLLLVISNISFVIAGEADQPMNDATQERCRTAMKYVTDACIIRDVSLELCGAEIETACTMICGTDASCMRYCTNTANNYYNNAPQDLSRNWGSATDKIRNNIVVESVRVNGGTDLVTGRATRETFERGETLGIKVEIEANADIEDGRVMAWIAGNDDSLLAEVSKAFNLRPNEGETLRKPIPLEITIPANMEIKDSNGNYQLHIIVSAIDSTIGVYNFPLKIIAQDNLIRIKDLTISPSTEVMAGRPFTVLARIENLGEENEEGVKVIVSVPELGYSVKNSDYIDTIEADDEVTSTDIYLRVPSNAKPGVYDVVVEVKYDDESKTETSITQIEIVNPNYADEKERKEDADEQSKPKQGKTIVQVGPEIQDVIKGQGGAIYPLTLTNDGSESKNYIISTAGVETFAAVQISPSNVVTVEPSESESVYVYVSAREDAQLGAHSFTVEIKSAEKTLQQIPLMANVVEGKQAGSNNSTLKNGLEIGLIVLVVVLIILGLIIAFARARKGDENEPLAGQTYY